MSETLRQVLSRRGSYNTMQFEIEKVIPNASISSVTIKTYRTEILFH